MAAESLNLAALVLTAEDSVSADTYAYLLATT
jgi:hypothetical protein